jgi:ABC-2 type transport system ATP-binding protein
MSIVETQNLTRSYNDVVAVDSLNIQVEQGRIYGLIGPNGAGKTTTVRILTTLLRPTQGVARVNGFDIVRQARQVRQCIGYVPQDAQADEALTGREHLVLQGRLYGMDAAPMARRIDEILELVGLRADADKRALAYSGGMRKLLNVASGLLHSPTVLFLDEPTSGVDVAHRQRILDHIRTLPAQGTTVFLTTHFLEEVDQLADVVALLDNGTIIAQGSPISLKERVGGSILNITFGQIDQGGMRKATEFLRQLPSLNKIIADGNRLRLFAANGDDLLGAVRQRLDDLSLPIDSLAVARPTLDDVFFYHIGREVA